MAIDNFRRVDFTLDKANGYIPSDQFAKESDNNGRELTVQITDGGVIKDQSSLVLTLAWKHDTAGNEGQTLFTRLNGGQGIFTVAYDNAMMIPGTVTACIQIADGSRLTNTRNFKLRIEDNPLNVDKAVAEDSFTVFIEALAGLAKYDGRISALETGKADNSYVSSELERIGVRDNAQDKAIAKNDSTLANKADKSYINDWLASMTSGPGYIKNYDQLLKQYPNGKNGLLVTADTDHKYIWDGAWEDMGVYGTQGIADGSIAPIKLMPNTSNGLLMTSGPVSFDPTTRTITLPDGSCSINYNGRWVKWIEQKNVTGVGQGGFITADVSGDKATLSYKEGGKLTNNDVIVGGVIGENLSMNAKMAINENDVPARVTSGMVLSGAPVRYENQKLIFSADTAFYSRNDYFVKKPFIFDLPENSGYFFANHSTQEVGFANGKDLHTGKYNEDWFVFGGIMQGVPYINGTLVTGADKYYLYLGDSITEGFRTSDEAVNNYPREVYNINHRLFRRYSVTGSTIAAPQDGKSFVERAKNIDFSQGTDIVIFGGHNDYKAGKQLGSLTSKDEATVLGALNVIVEKIYADNPSAKIKMISPNWRVVNENDPTNPVNNDIDEWKNSAGLMFKDYVTALNQFAESHGFPILNLRKEWAVNKLNQKQWLVDGLHPNDAGQRFLGETVERFLR